MANYSHHRTQQHSSHRALAMVLALVSAIVLSPLYGNKKTDHNQRHQSRGFNEPRWISAGFVLPMVLAGLIIAIRTTSGLNSSHSYGASSVIPSPDPSWVLRIGGSSWGLGGVLVMLMLVLSWQESVQDLFWR